MTPALAEALDLSTDRGALVTQIEAGSPRNRQASRRANVIVAVDEKPIESSTDLRNTVGLVRAGESVAVRFLRLGQRRTAHATVAATRPAVRGERRQPIRARCRYWQAQRSWRYRAIIRRSARPRCLGQCRRAGLRRGALRPASRRRHHGRQREPVASAVALAAGLDRTAPPIALRVAARRASVVPRRALTRPWHARSTSSVADELRPQPHRVSTPITDRPHAVANLQSARCLLRSTVVEKRPNARARVARVASMRPTRADAVAWTLLDFSRSRTSSTVESGNK